MKRISAMRGIVFGIMLSLFCSYPGRCAYAQTLEHLAAGNYAVEASLSCYINAMGGVEFGGPMLKRAEICVEDGGTATVTMYLEKSVVNIYSVVCDTFIDAEPAGAVTEGSVPCGTIGCYREDGTLVTDGVSYTLSSDTALNSKQEQVHYVDSITFPIESENSTYNLTLYVNSNVMGTQFSQDSYPAVLSVDWTSAAPKGEGTGAEAAAPEAEKASAETAADAAEVSTEEAETETEKKNVEKMGGLNIYRAETQEESTEEAVEETMVSVTEAEGYMAYFDKTVLAIVGTAGVMLIVLGTVLMMLGSREEKKACD